MSESSAVSEFINSPTFIYGVLAGYLASIVGVVFNQTWLLAGMPLSMLVSVLVYFAMFIENMNQLSGCLTIDVILYRPGQKPIVKKLYIKSYHDLNINDDDFDIKNYDDFILKESDTIYELNQVLKKKVENIANQKQISEEEKRDQIKELLNEELQLPEKVKNIYAYRCELIEPLTLPENSKMKSKKITYTQVVIVSKRKFKNEFPDHKDRVIYKNQLISTALTFAMFIMWDIAADDTPILYSRFTDADAFKRITAVADAQTIKSGYARILQKLILYLKSKYVAIDRVLSKKDEKIREILDEKNKLEQFNMKANAKRLEGKKPAVSEKKMIVSKALFYLIVIVLILLIATIAFILGSGNITNPFPITPTNSTTTMTPPLITLLGIFGA